MDDLNLNMDLFDEGYAQVDLEEFGPVDTGPIDDDDIKKVPSEGVKDPEVVAGDGEGDEGSGKSGDKSLPNLYSSLAKALAEEGFLPSLENYDNIDSFDKIGDQIKEANKAALKDALGFDLGEVDQLTPLQKEYLTALSQGIPAETFVQTKREEVAIDAITDEAIEADEQLRKDLIINNYISKGIAPEKAAKLAQSHIDQVEDVDEAKAARDELKAAIQENAQREFEYQQALRADMERQNKEDEESLRKAFYDTDKIGDTFDISRQLKDKMFDAISKPVARTEDGTLVNAITRYQMENPIDFQHKVAWLYSITDGFKQFDSFVTRKAMTKATKELESVLNSTKFDSLGKVSSPELDDNAVYGVNDYKYDEEA